MDTPRFTGSGVPVPSLAGHIHLILGVLDSCKLAHFYNSIVESWVSIKLSLYTHDLCIKPA